MANVCLFSGRRRALDRAMDAALKNPNKRRRRADGIVSYNTRFAFYSKL